jgi:hypothetical protein
LGDLGDETEKLGVPLRKFCGTNQRLGLRAHRYAAACMAEAQTGNTVETAE